MKLELHAIVQGDVQGVFFRATTRKFAEEMGVTGTVRNVSDGTVEIHAQGSRELLDRFLEKLILEGPGHIDEIEKEYFTPVKDYEGFVVKR